MVGFISLLSLIAIIFGGVWSLVANFVENIEKEDIKIIQKKCIQETYTRTVANIIWSNP